MQPDGSIAAELTEYGIRTAMIESDRSYWLERRPVPVDELGKIRCEVEGIESLVIEDLPHLNQAGAREVAARIHFLLRGNQGEMTHQQRCVYRLEEFPEIDLTVTRK
jgi:hypothetical protein